MCTGVAIFRPTGERARTCARMRGLTTLEKSRESAELDSIVSRGSRAMSGAFRPWGKRQSRESRERARRCGAEFQVNGTTIARCLTRTKLARGLFDRGNSVPDRGANAECANGISVARASLSARSRAAPRVRLTMRAASTPGGRPLHRHRRQPSSADSPVAPAASPRSK